MVMPGVTTRKLRVKRVLWGRRTAFTVCQAMSIAITAVLPAPVASFRATRERPGFAASLASSIWFRNPRPRLPRPGATSVSQMAVSTASTWQKNGRMPLNGWCRQCFSSRAVSGVTRHCRSGSARHAASSRRRPSISAIRSYCWSSVESAAPSAS